MHQTLNLTVSETEDRAMAAAFLEDMDRYTALRVEQEEMCSCGDKSELQPSRPATPMKSETPCE